MLQKDWPIHRRKSTLSVDGMVTIALTPQNCYLPKARDQTMTGGDAAVT
jgi:hypothetical protein